MMYLFHVVAWVPAVEPGACSHIEIRAGKFKKRFALQGEAGYWGTWLIAQKAIKEKTGWRVPICNVEIDMVSINGRAGPTLPAGICGGQISGFDALIGSYNEPPSCRAIKKKKPLVDAHWNATFGTVIGLGLATEYQAPG